MLTMGVEHSFFVLHVLPEVPRAASSLGKKLLCEGLAFYYQKETLQAFLL